MSEHRGVEYTLTQRRDSWQFNVRVIEKGDRKRIRQSHPSEDAAREACKSVIDRSLEGLSATPPTPAQFSTPTLQRVFELVHDGQWKGTKGMRTAVKNAEDCIAYLGSTRPIDSITTENIDGLIGDFKDREMESGTILRKLAALSTLIKFAANRHWVKALPMIDRKSAGKERKRLRFLSHEEEADALKFLREYGSDEPGRGKEMADFFIVLIDTGLRLSENVNLKWSEVDGERAIRLGFDNKGEEPRLVPFTDRVIDIIKARRAARVPGDKRVWPDMTSDRADYFWQLVRKSQSQQDDPDFVLHSLRHTFASRLAMQGVELYVIKELGGWKTLAMVARYAHLMPKQKEDAIRKMQGKTGTAG